MYKCAECAKEFATQNQLRGHIAHCKLHKEKYRLLYQRHFSEKFLRWWFEKKHETANFLAALFNEHYKDYARVTAGIIIGLAKSYNINTNGFACYKQCKRLHKMYEGTNNTLAQGNVGFNTCKTTLAKEGITNVFQRESVKHKIKTTLFTKYGVHSVTELPWYTHNSGVMSREHKIVHEYLQTLNLNVVSEMQSLDKTMFCKYNETLDRFYTPRPDIILLNEKLIIEIYGDYWHANPKHYKETDTIKLWRCTKTAKEIHVFDEIRKRHLESFGFDVLEIWTSDVISR